ncbi:MAG: SMODS domain-containing nucleotidyltransferase [Promethearchaeota archaeon]
MINESTPSSIQPWFNQLLTNITPTDQEQQHLSEIIQKITSIIQKSVPSKNIKINFITPQGSTGIKDTALRNASDIDLFIGLDPGILGDVINLSKSKIRNYIRDLFKNLITDWLIPELLRHQIQNPVKNYAEHPYISAKFQGVDLDIVFCFDISEEFLFSKGLLTAVDRTPHHSRYICQNITNLQRNEVRILKFLFQKLNCYGDKSAIGRSGFLGYIAELLIVKYDSVWNLMQNFPKLESTIIFLPPLNPELKNPYKNLSIASARKKYFQNDFLVIIDPTDIHRNVGSSVSFRAYRSINKAFQDFLSNPNQEFFVKKPLPSIKSINSLKLVYPLSNFFYAEFKTTDYSHYTKFRDKLYSAMDKFISQASQEVTLETRFEHVIGELLFDASMGEFVLAFFVSTPEISTEFIRQGPKINVNAHVNKFREKHPQAYIENGKWCAIKERKYTSFYVIMKDYFNTIQIKNLAVSHLGTAYDENYTLLASQSMANLALNVLPFEDLELL